MSAIASPSASAVAAGAATAAAHPRQSTASSSSALSGGAASPVPHASSSRTKFDAAQLQPHLSSVLNSRLRNAAWDKSDKEKNRALSRSIAENVKAKMLEIEPRGFKYIVQVQLVENLGQGGRADLACHWEDTDSVVQDMYSNDTLICTVLCFAIRT